MENYYAPPPPLPNSIMIMLYLYQWKLANKDVRMSAVKILLDQYNLRVIHPNDEGCQNLVFNN